MQDVQGSSDPLADVRYQTTQPVISLQPTSISTAGIGGFQKPSAAGPLPQTVPRWELGLQQPLGPQSLGPGLPLGSVPEQLTGSGLKSALEPDCCQPCHPGLQKPVGFSSEPWPSDSHAALQPLLQNQPVPAATTKAFTTAFTTVTRYGRCTVKV